jgi:flagellar basal body-associated protein FliL
MMITILISLIVIFIIGLLCRNRWLEAKREKLESENKNNARTINIQNRVTDVIQNTKPTDFDGNIKRMYDGEL